MTEKRFHSESDCVGYYTEIIDEQKKLDLTIPNPKKNLVVEELVDLLNVLNEENEQLKKELDQFYLLIGRGDWSGLVDLIIRRR